MALTLLFYYLKLNLEKKLMNFNAILKYERQDLRFSKLKKNYSGI